MEDPRTAIPLPLSAAEAESFFATGQDARVAAPDFGRVPEELQGSPGRSGRTGAADDGSRETPAGGMSAAAVNRDDQADGFAESDLRCRECGNLKRATPKHKLNCRYAFANCPGCVYAGEGHLASCPIATQLKLTTDDCCEGVDLPSVGHVHSPDCRNTRPVVRASATLPRPAELVAENPADLFGQLLFASRDMALRRVLPGVGTVGPGYCTDCGGWLGRTSPGHESNCATARVLDLVARVCKASPAMAQMGGAL